MKSIDLTVLLMLFAAVTVITNIAVEVFKSFITFSSTARLNAFVVLVAELATAVVLLIYFPVSGTAFAWYVIPGGIVFGILAAYSAMFGYDKLLSRLSELGIFKED